MSWWCWGTLEDEEDEVGAMACGGGGGRMRAASWIRATCCTSPRSFSWCDNEQSDVVESLK